MARRKSLFGRDVRLSKPHVYHSELTAPVRLVRAARRNRAVSIVLCAAAVVAGLAILIWGLPLFGQSWPPSPWVYGAAVFATCLIAQGGLALVFQIPRDFAEASPREGIEYGAQAVTLDRNGVRVVLDLVQRRYAWRIFEEMSEESEGFTLTPKVGRAVVIPKDTRMLDEIRLRLLRGITRR